MSMPYIPIDYKTEIDSGANQANRSIIESIPKMLVMIDGPMINRFIEDVDGFWKCVDDRFHELDGDGDGFLSRIDVRRRFSPSEALDHAPKSPAVGTEEEEDTYNERTCDLIFNRFDFDRNGSIDREEFRPMVTEMLMAVARGIGSTPVNVGVEEDSLLVRVYEHDLARTEKELTEDRKGGKGIGGKALWKKRSRKVMKSCCFCSGCFGSNTTVN